MDSDLVQFIRSCGELEALVDDIRMAGFKTQDGSELLLQNERMILGHFFRLTRDYSPALVKAAENFPSLTKTIRFFVGDSQNAAKEINDFFLKYPVHINSLQFASDYGKIFGLLLHCVHKQNAVVGLLEHMEQKENTLIQAVKR